MTVRTSFKATILLHIFIELSFLVSHEHCGTGELYTAGAVVGVCVWLLGKHWTLLLEKRRLQWSVKRNAAISAVQWESSSFLCLIIALRRILIPTEEDFTAQREVFINTKMWRRLASLRTASCNQQYLELCYLGSLQSSSFLHYHLWTLRWGHWLRQAGKAHGAKTRHFPLLSVLSGSRFETVLGIMC